jgi:hypothetical protein
MKKVKTSELSGAELDYCVGMCEKAWEDADPFNITKFVRAEIIRSGNINACLLIPEKLSMHQPRLYNPSVP